jgi:hypothetical protein
MEKLNISDEQFYNLVKMLNASVEDGNVALATINNVDFNKNLCKILLLHKLSNNPNAWSDKNNMRLWRFMVKVKNGSDDGDPLSWNAIFKMLLVAKVPATDIQFFFDVFKEKLFNSIADMGYRDLISSVDIKLIFNENKQNRNLSESI